MRWLLAVALMLASIWFAIQIVGAIRRWRRQTQVRRAIAEAVDGGIERRLGESVAKIAAVTGVDSRRLAESVAENINAEIARRRAAGDYDPLYKRLWRRYFTRTL